MYEDFFATRIAELRSKKGVSAREMSLSIGQSQSYINKIENGNAFPSMELFFYICEYFNITPKEFFDDGISNSALIQSVIKDLTTLDEKQILNIWEIIKGLKGNK